MTLIPNKKEKIIQKALAIQMRANRLREKILPILTSWQKMNLGIEHEIDMIEKAASGIIGEVGQ